MDIKSVDAVESVDLLGWDTTIEELFAFCQTSSGVSIFSQRGLQSSKKPIETRRNNRLVLSRKFAFEKKTSEPNDRRKLSLRTREFRAAAYG